MSRVFFSYMSLFTFAMLCLVMADDFILLFFGWEGVGLISYLLIGFWYQKDAAVVGGFKAFIVNRVGDIGFLLAIACAIIYFGSTSYTDVFAQLAYKSSEMIRLGPGLSASLMTVMTVLLFIGAAAKSAQVPLHVWLPESMEGPTPISALIHAATMVTAGVFMLCRLSPLLDYSPITLSIILVIGALTALLMGLVALVQCDIKRVIAYSTLSQLGYMMMGVGSMAYQTGLFHLFTHACFKALLFLAAGSVIIGMHHEQDMRRMGGLWKRMPITWLTFLIGALALTAVPPFSGFYSKESIIEAVHHSSVTGASFAYVCALIGAFVTALYTFRAFLMTFHGQPRFDEKHQVIQESPWVMLFPLVILALPSVGLGLLLVHLGVEEVSSFHLTELSPAFIGIMCAFYFYRIHPSAADRAKRYFGLFYQLLLGQYGFNEINAIIFVSGIRRLGQFAYRVVDTVWIEKYTIQRISHYFLNISHFIRGKHSGSLGYYALCMLGGVFILIASVCLGI
ncbi:MAG: NADH-quinone oxidoreductase subunit L [Gammaproteobacteria bacterium]|nr:NADH-quinone oxidoreductase subunit L [Gammaproteobacteria bacterium]